MSKDKEIFETRKKLKREIKFKAKRLDGKGWVYGNLINMRNCQCYIFNHYFIPAVSIQSERFIEVDPETVCQLITKIGDVEIWESDTVTVMYDGIERCEDIGILHGCAMIGSIMSMYSIYTDSYKGCLESLKVVGNIHD